MSTGVVAHCSVCGLSVPPGRAHCGAAPDLGAAPPKAVKPRFGQGKRKPVAPVNKERKAKTFARCFGPQSRMCRLVGCAVPSCKATPLTAKIEPDHVRTRGAGGDDSSCWPLCARHHGLRHSLGLETFQERYGVLGEVVALRMAELVRDHECTAWPSVDSQGRAICAVCLDRLPEGTP